MIGSFWLLGGEQYVVKSQAGPNQFYLHRDNVAPTQGPWLLVTRRQLEHEQLPWQRVVSWTQFRWRLLTNSMV